MEKKMDKVQEILTKLETADNTTKNQLENELVNIGTEVVPVLVEQLQVSKGVKRGVVAMTLIRIGSSAVSYLKQAADKNEDFKWVAKYLVNEIECTQVA